MNVDLRTTVGAFVLVFLAVIGVAAVGGVVLDGGSPETDAVADDHDAEIRVESPNEAYANTI